MALITKINLIILALIVINCCECGTEHKDQLCALESFYHETNGDNWIHKWNWMNNSVNYCDWHGVLCDTDNYVIELRLACNNLSGKLPSKISFLEKLIVIDLYDNNIIYGLEYLTNMPKLTRMDLSANNVVESIPSSIGLLSSLRAINLYGNKLYGPVKNLSMSLINFFGTVDFSLKNQKDSFQNQLNISQIWSFYRWHTIN